MQLTCPVTASGSVTLVTSTGGGVIKLTCRQSRGKRTAHIAHGHKASSGARGRTTKWKPAVRRHVKHPARQIFLCKSI
jgi:hypothetical protein